MKSPTTPWTRSAGIVGGDRRDGLRAARDSRDVERRRTARSVPRARSASSSSRVFSDEPEPSSTRVWAPVRAAISRGVALQDLPLGAGRVVLRQPGDLLEQLAAARVVEPLGRQPLRCRRQPVRASARSAFVGVVGGAGGRRSMARRCRVMAIALLDRVRRVDDARAGSARRRTASVGDRRLPGRVVVVRLGGDTTAPRVRPTSRAWVQVVPTTRLRRR